MHVRNAGLFFSFLDFLAIAMSTSDPSHSAVNDSVHANDSATRQDIEVQGHTPQEAVTVGSAAVPPDASAASASSAPAASAATTAATTADAAPAASAASAANTAATEATSGADKATELRSMWREIFSKRMGICVVTGFASGMPLFVLINLLSAFLRKEGLDLKVIGAFSLMMIPYTWKFLWAPFVDRFQIFHLGRRKDWMILSQVVLILSIGAMGFFNPQDSILIVAALATLIAFASATQDIVLDAYRREFLPTNELGLGNAIFVNAYRVAGLGAGGVLPDLADYGLGAVGF